MMRFYLGDSKIRQLLLRSIIARRSLVQKLSDAPMRRDVEKGIQVFVEVTLRIVEIEKAHRRDQDPHRVLTNAYSLHLLQHQSTKQAEVWDREENVAISQQETHQSRSLAKRLWRN